MIFGDERRGADCSCILALNWANYNWGDSGVLVGREAPLHDGHCTRSTRNTPSHGREPLL